MPILAEYRRQRGIDATRALVGNVGTLLAVVLIVLSVARRRSRRRGSSTCWPAASRARPARSSSRREMIRIVFPYILFVSLVSLAGGVLNVTGGSPFPRSRR